MTTEQQKQIEVFSGQIRDILKQQKPTGNPFVVMIDHRGFIIDRTRQAGKSATYFFDRLTLDHNGNAVDMTGKIIDDLS